MSSVLQVGIMKVSDHVDMCARCVDFTSVSKDCWLDVGTVPTVWYIDGNFSFYAYMRTAKIIITDYKVE